jgi:hypothetical protein
LRQRLERETGTMANSCLREGQMLNPSMHSSITSSVHFFAERTHDGVEMFTFSKIISSSCC